MTVNRQAAEIISNFFSRSGHKKQFDIIRFEEQGDTGKNYSYLAGKDFVLQLLSNISNKNYPEFFFLRESGNHSERSLYFKLNSDSDFLEDYYTYTPSQKEVPNMSARNIRSVKVLEQALAPYNNAPADSVIRGYKNGVHSWNWNLGNVRSEIARIAPSSMKESDNIEISLPNSAAMSPGVQFDPNSPIEWVKIATVVANKERAATMKGRAVGTIKDGFADMMDGAKTRTIHVMGANLVDAMSSVLPNEEVKNFLSNDMAKTGVQGILAFIIKGACDEGAIPARLAPFVKIACEKQLEALGYEFAGPVLDQIVPLGGLLISELASAGRGLMTKEQVQEIENSFPKEEVSAPVAFKAANEEDIEIAVEEEQEEEEMNRPRTMSA